ncbi:MAG: hypothetical protein GF308_06815 [Candidatus Heimdallarchaeota archaeon]|nr:hypothetical protein [Candidatus Heimdallarchaeota archaeon]
MLDEKILPIGIDLGTSTIKVSCYKGQILNKIPSIIGDPNPGFTGLLIDKSLLNNLVLREKNRSYYVGELARLQSDVRRPIASEGKVRNTNLSVLAIKAALSIIEEEMAGNNNKELVIATGVPIATSREEMKKISAAVTGSHKIHVINDATEQEKKYQFNIRRCFVLPEPFGCYYRMLVLKGEQRAVDSVIIDIGHGSTDILSIYSGRMMRMASGSIVEAVDTLTERISRALTEQANKIIRPYELMRTIETGQDTLQIGNEILDISSAKHYYIQAIARIIADEVTKLVGTLPPDAWIEEMLLTGGGAHIFADEIKKELVELQVIVHENEISVPEDPVMANALGFEMIAEKRTEQISEQLIKEFM